MLSFIPNAITNPWLKQNLNILMPTSTTNKKSQFSTNFQQFSNLDLATVRLACIPYKNSDESPLSSQFIEKLIAHHKDWFQVFIWKSFLRLMRSYCTFRRKRQARTGPAVWLSATSSPSTYSLIDISMHIHTVIQTYVPTLWYSHMYSLYVFKYSLGQADLRTHPVIQILLQIKLERNRETIDFIFNGFVPMLPMPPI